MNYIRNIWRIVAEKYNQPRCTYVHFVQITIPNKTFMFNKISTKRRRVRVADGRAEGGDKSTDFENSVPQFRRIFPRSRHRVRVYNVHRRGRYTPQQPQRKSIPRNTLGTTYVHAHIVEIHVYTFPILLYYTAAASAQCWFFDNPS